MPQQHPQIFRLWWPLAATWLMMAAEGPFLAALIARLPNEKVNLAAYGIAYALGLIVEAPVIMLLSAATSVARDRCGYLRLRRFAILLCVLVTLLLGLLFATPVFTFLTSQLLGLTDEVAHHIRIALALLLPWPAAIGMRRFYQGVLIAHQQSRAVAAGTVVRLLGMSGVALALFSFSDLPGAAIGAAALSCGVLGETCATRYLARHAIASSLKLTPPEPRFKSDRDLLRYYIPLALTPLIGLSVHPMVTFFLGHAPQALDSLAIMPVIYALTFLFRALGLSMPEVALTLLEEERGNRVAVRNFAVKLGLALGGGLSLIAFTPLHSLWFEQLSGLSRELSLLGSLPLQILALFPALTVVVGYQRALLINTGITGPISVASAIEAGSIFLLLGALIAWSALPGVVSAAIAYLVGRLLGIAYQSRPCHKARKILEQTLQTGTPLPD